MDTLIIGAGLGGFRRPPNAASEIEGRYFAGGTAHPGGGVPMVILSGAAAARQILKRAH